MIKREMYMSRIRPFIGSDLVKVLTGIRRCGKSVMLALIQEEITSSGVDPSQFISINFENMSNAGLCTAQALHDEIICRAAKILGKVYLFLMKSKRYRIGKHVSIPSGWSWTAIFILQVLMPSCSPASWLRI